MIWQDYSSRLLPLLLLLQIMSCPGGCIGGGGQPKTKGPDVLQRRMSAVYSIDSNMHLRKSHENPQIKVSLRPVSQ
jgi:iron only hydrogenase large subunit-like protein